MSVGHYENFPVASRLLPARYRGAVVAIYRFARAADDIADEGDATPAERHAALDALRRARSTRSSAATTPPDAAVSRAGRGDRARTGCRSRRFATCSPRFAQDVDVDALSRRSPSSVDYCRRSANPVGRLLLALYDADDAQSRVESDAICTALQLANFWQDVAVDWRKGRVYIPLEDLARFGVTWRTSPTACATRAGRA